MVNRQGPKQLNNTTDEVIKINFDYFRTKYMYMKKHEFTFESLRL